MDKELKPCPFCGSKATIADEEGYILCEGEGCGFCFDTTGHDSEDHAIAAWNRRPAPEAAERAKSEQLTALDQIREEISIYDKLTERERLDPQAARNILRYIKRSMERYDAALSPSDRWVDKIRFTDDGAVERVVGTLERISRTASRVTGRGEDKGGLLRSIQHDADSALRALAAKKPDAGSAK